MANIKACTRKRMVGHNVSHSNIKSKRTFKINTLTKKVKTTSGNKTSISMSTKLLRTWRKKGGTFEALMQLVSKGE